jgi:hypothetical protein
MTRKYVITFYRETAEPDLLGPWRWRMQCRTRVVGESHTGFSGRQECMQNCTSVTGFKFEAPAGAPTSFQVTMQRRASAPEASAIG